MLVDSGDDAVRAVVLRALASGDPWDWMRAQLRRMRWRPALARHERALVEMGSGDHRLDVHTLAGLANTAHAAYRRRGVRRRVVCAAWLAHELDVIATRDVACTSAMYDDETRVLVYPARADPIEEEVDLFHELAEAAVGRRGTHGDVWTLTCAFAVEQNPVETAVNLHGLSDAVDRMVRRYRNVPPWVAACGTAFWAFVAHAPRL